VRRDYAPGLSDEEAATKRPPIAALFEKHVGVNHMPFLTTKVTKVKAALALLLASSSSTPFTTGPAQVVREMRPGSLAMTS
jgi:hypothetical protein